LFPSEREARTLVDIELYRKFYPVQNVRELVREFQDSLITTNRTPEFFVNWTKVKKNADEIRIELSLWNSLIGSNNIETDFVNLIERYPEAVKTIPILFAIREREFPVIVDFDDLQKSLKNLNFNKTRHSKLTSEEISDYVDFAKKGGLLQLFHYIRNFYDYVFGVEVGLDTNARKNRSGEAMETLLTPLLKIIAAETKSKLLFQKEFNSVQLFGGKIPKELANRKSDFILYLGNHFVNIETNYFSGAGSKPEEIVDSYINRRNELVKNNWSFIWITDGGVWRSSGNQILKAFNYLDYVFNIQFCRKGLLKEALLQIFSEG
jgi:type II restriction enzyme